MGSNLDYTEEALKGKIKNNYQILEKLEDNSLSFLFKCKEKNTNNLVAIRVYIKQYLERIYGPDKLEFANNNLRKEIEYLKLCEGDYSLKLIDELEDKDCFNIVTELWDTTLEKHIINLGGALTLKEIKEIFSKLNIGLSEMYNNDIIHGDLNLKNILVKYKEDDSIIPKITHYGKKILFNEKLGLMHSETYYSAPELLGGEKYNNKVDLWSIGIILYRLYFGEFPYKGKTQVAIYNQIINQVPIKKRGKDDDLFDDLISKLLQINPNQRLCWEEYFAHEFWLNKDIDEDSESDDNEIIDEYNAAKKKNNDDINKKKENDDNDKRKHFTIFYSVNNAGNLVEINGFSMANNMEEFPIEEKKRLKKMEIYLNDEDLNNNVNQNPTQENDMENNPKQLFSELLLKNLIKKIQNKKLYKLMLYGCQLNEIEALNKPYFENLTELDLSNNFLDNLDIFTNSTFKNLISLNLNHNNISDLDPLKNACFTSLLNLSLTNNKIANIDVLANVPFQSLDKLDLSSNLITNIEIFEYVSFQNLTYLNVSDNQITDAKSPLNKIKLPNLIILDLSHNNISEIYGLNSNQYQQLKMLNLGKNKINNIKILSRVPFADLRILLLFDNQISDISVFSVVPFTNLNYLNLSYNEISNINVFNNVPFKNLEKLDLSGNNISSIDQLLNMPINDLRELNIKNNKIEENNNILEEMKKKYKYISIS